MQTRTFRLRPFNPHRGVPGPFGPKVGNGVENEFPGPSGPGAQKVKNGVQKESKKLKFQLFSNFFDSFVTPFLTFWAPGPEGPRNSFSTPLPTLGPKGPATPLWGLKGRNFQRDLGAIGPYEFQGKSVWTNPLVPCFLEKSVWTNGPESSSNWVHTE